MCCGYSVTCSSSTGSLFFTFIPQMYDLNDWFAQNIKTLSVMIISVKIKPHEWYRSLFVWYDEDAQRGVNTFTVRVREGFFPPPKGNPWIRIHPPSARCATVYACKDLTPSPDASPNGHHWASFSMSISWWRLKKKQITRRNSFLREFYAPLVCDKSCFKWNIFQTDPGSFARMNACMHVQAAVLQPIRCAHDQQKEPKKLTVSLLKSLGCTPCGAC